MKYGTEYRMECIGESLKNDDNRLLIPYVEWYKNWCLLISWIRLPLCHGAY